MSRRMALVAAPQDGELIAAEGDFEWGTARIFAPGEEPEGDVVVELAGVRAGSSGSPVVRWLEGAAEAGPQLMIAPAGEGLWRRRPLPVADACFALPEPTAPAALVVGSNSPQRSELIARAGSVGVEAQVTERISLATLRRASSVAFADSPDGVVSPWAFCVLAAGRVLLAPAHDVGFGLRHGIDHLQFNDPDELASYLRSAQVDAPLFESLRARGLQAAERRRATTVLATLVADLEIEGRLT